MRVVSLFVPIALLTLFVWLAAELSVFFYVADQIGFFGAVLLSLATSYVGILLLRRIGGAARQRLFELLRTPTAGFSVLDFGLRDGAAAAIGAVLLILPGFLSDALGAILALAASGFWLQRPLPAERKAEDVVDLSPEEWRHLESARLPKNLS
jgi:UPF0716 protein FxsA